MNSFDYEFINRYNALYSPSTVHCLNTGLQMYFAKYLLQQAFSRYDFILPKRAGWDKTYFLYTLFCAGHGVVFKTPRYGTIFQYCTLGGYNLNYMPKYAVVANPALDRTYELNIDEDCVIIKMQPLYSGVMDIISYYADLMALTSESIGVNILNSKLGYIFFAGNRSVADSMKKLYDNIASGNPMVVADEKLIDKESGKLKVQLFTQDLKNNYIAPELFIALKDIENKFLTDIGFNNINIQKKERMNVHEVDANNEAIKSKATLWLETMKESFSKANDMFNLDLQVSFSDLGTKIVTEGGSADGK